MSEAFAEPRLEAAPRRLTTVVAADICGYSRLAEIDDDAAIRTVNFVRAAFEQVVARRRGRIFHTAGDGFLAEFPSAADGVLAALEFVADIKARDKLSPINPGAQVRAGVHAGDVIEQPNGDLLGHGVNVAARLQAEAEPNGVVVSLAVVNLVRDSVGAQFARRGPLALRNIDEPVVAFDVEFGDRRAGSLGILRRLRATKPLHAVVVLGAVAAIYTASNMGGGQIAVAKRLSLSALATQSPPVQQDDANLDEAWRPLRYPVRAPSETIWLRGILNELRRSGEEVDREVFDLLAKKDLGAAVIKLKNGYETKKKSLTDAERVSYLLTLGALTFDHAPGDSVAFHKAVLDMAPRHFLAHVRLGELYYNQSEYVRADRAFREALAIGSPFRDQEVYAQIKYAASMTIEERYEEAMRLLVAAKEEAESRGWNSLVVLALNRIAYVELKRENFPAARKTLTVTAALAPAEDFPDEYVFIYSALGRMKLEEGDFTGAERLLETALELAFEVGRPAGIADTYFYVGLVQVELGEPKKAEETFQAALDVARGARSFGYNNLKNMEVKNHIGKSLAYKAQGLGDRACQEMAVADEVDARRDIIYNPKTIQLVRRVGCPFGPLDYLVAAK